MHTVKAAPFSMSPSFPLALSRPLMQQRQRCTPSSPLARLLPWTPTDGMRYQTLGCPALTRAALAAMPGSAISGSTSTPALGATRTLTQRTSHAASCRGAHAPCTPRLLHTQRLHLWHNLGTLSLGVSTQPQSPFGPLRRAPLTGYMPAATATESLEADTAVALERAGATLEQANSATADASSGQTTAPSDSGEPASQRQGYVVVNCYHLVDVDNPNEVMAEHKARLAGGDVKGRIYISSQGINAQYSGPADEAVAYAEWMAARPPFKGLRYTTAPVDKHMFPRLRLAHKASLVSLAGGTQGLPITDPSARATPLSPSAWKEMLRHARVISPPAPQHSSDPSSPINGGSPTSLHSSPTSSVYPSSSNPSSAGNCTPSGPGGRTASATDAGPSGNETRNSKGSWRSLGDSPRPVGAVSGGSSGGSGGASLAVHGGGGSGNAEGGEDGSSGSGGDVVVLDVRNGYEWDAGHFQGAERPNEATFSETPTEAGSTEVPLPQALVGRDPDAPVMMYCTGGIRCDVYSAYLRTKGFTNLYTLEGGVHKYLSEQGGVSWNGSLFVFDDRLAVPAGPPSESEDEETASTAAALPAAVPCQLCEGPLATLPHCNCANLDCARLFVACDTCKVKLRGCCCEECRGADIVRPLSQGTGRAFGKVSTMFSPDELAKLAERRGDGRLKRRRVREARLRAIRHAQKEKRAKRRAEVKAALREREQLEQPEDAEEGSVSRQEEPQPAGCL
mmetsp:Transcript_18341/g.55232  ORF Transcript_18341/g.55232 Transcript_18341/m.55232 type:complete len:735 (+) Transcript_18341:409-2613(+)